MRYHFKCLQCGFSDTEAETLAAEDQTLCGLCAGGNGRDVRLKRWPSVPGMTRAEAAERQLAEGDRINPKHFANH